VFYKRLVWNNLYIYILVHLLIIYSIYISIFIHLMQYIDLPSIYNVNVSYYISHNILLKQAQVHFYIKSQHVAITLSRATYMHH